jgi:hypothetical protein
VIKPSYFLDSGNSFFKAYYPYDIKGEYNNPMALQVHFQNYKTVYSLSYLEIDIPEEIILNSNF